jgi:cytochrome c biogenesis protein CcdA
LKYISWTIIVLFWIITLFPNLWKNISTKLWFSDNSNKLLWKASQKEWVTGSIMMWAALWPVFTSCSPTYGIILSIIIAWEYVTWLVNLVSYTIWLAVILLAIALLGQKFVAKLKFASDPNGIFKKVLWVLFLVVWIAILTGLDKQFEAYLIADLWWFGALDFEQGIIEKTGVKD